MKPLGGRRPNPLAAKALACLLSALAMPAFAGRPLTTDDADVLEARACEWESLAARLRNPQPAQGTAWQTQLGCGVGGRMQLAGSIASNQEQGERTEMAGIGAKVQLVGGDTPDQPRLAATIAVNMLRVNASAFEVQDNSLALVASHALGGDWTGHLNLGWTYNRPDRQSSTTWNLALERPLGHGVDGVGEVFGDDRGRPWFSGGLRWSMSAHASVNVSFGVRRDGDAAERLATAGFKLAF